MALSPLVCTFSILLIIIFVGRVTAWPPRPVKGTARRLFLAESDVATAADGTPALHRVDWRVNAPSNAGPVITPTEPWESWAVFAYNSVMQVGPEDAIQNATYRLYYDCVSQKRPGRHQEVSTSIGFRFTCLALSTDGINWFKPKLGVATFNGSTANNIVFPRSDVNYANHEPGAAFLDTRDGVPSSQRWKMLARWTNVPQNGTFGTYVLASPDGVDWNPMFAQPSISGSDTFNVGWWDEALNSYVAYVRLDVHGSKWGERHVARCMTTDLSNFGSKVDIFAVDATDPNLSGRLDVYTSSATRLGDDYGGRLLFMPSFYFHFTSTAPWGYGNDGILDVRLLTASNASTSPQYVPARNGRAPFMSLGPNSCVFSGSVDDRGGWCSATNGDLAKTASDTSARYAAAGIVTSLDGSKQYVFASGQPMTHGGDAATPTWAANTQITRFVTRLDGYASLDGDYSFNGTQSSADDLPQVRVAVTTVPTMAEANCPAGSVLQLQANVVTGVAGWAAFAFIDNETNLQIGNYTIEEGDAWRGDAMYRGMSWRGGLTSVEPLAGKVVSVLAVLPDARLFGLQFGCGAAGQHDRTGRKQ